MTQKVRNVGIFSGKSEKKFGKRETFSLGPTLVDNPGARLGSIRSCEAPQPND